MKQPYFSVWARSGPRLEPGRCWPGNFSMPRRLRLVEFTSLGEATQPPMIVLELARSRSASVGTCTGLIIHRCPGRNSIQHAKSVTVKPFGSYQGDLRRWANGGLSDERALTWIHGELVANANILMRNISPIDPLNARNVLVLNSHLTFAALLATKSLKHMKQSGKLNGRGWRRGSQCGRISCRWLKTLRSSKRLWRNLESMAAQLKSGSVTK